MRLFQAIVGIDPSGDRLVAVAAHGGTGRVVGVPLVHDMRGESESARLAKAEAALGDFVVRQGLVGAEARLGIPAGKVLFGRVVLPPLKDADLQEAVESELERLFPCSPAGLRFTWKRLPDATGGKTTPLLVVAAQEEYLDRWEELLSRVGLTLKTAVPSARAIGAGLSHAGVPLDGPTAVVRDTGGSVECALFSGGDPVFSSARECSREEMPAEGLSMAEAGLTDEPAAEEKDAPVLIAPRGWYGDGPGACPTGETAWRLNETAAESVRAAIRSGSDADGCDSMAALAAYGAALSGRSMDLLAPEPTDSRSRLATFAVAVTAAAALLLMIAWPATLARQARKELRRIDAEIATLRPAVKSHEEALADIEDHRARLAVFENAASLPREPLEILRELTDRLPDGTAIQSLQNEGRKVEIEGTSLSASELFPRLTAGGRFRGVAFAAPITRGIDNTERFRIRAEYVPPGMAPEGASPKAPGAPESKR
ncbi:MAG: PilN domain-containing protein [Candidatus Deferrimicrobium sp.]